MNLARPAKQAERHRGGERLVRIRPAAAPEAGAPLQPALLAFGSRTFAGNDTRVVFGGRVMVHAKVRIDESQTPIAVDYLSLKDQKISLGILAFDGEILRVCMAPAGAPRPAEFTSTKANGWLVSDWKRR